MDDDFARSEYKRLQRVAGKYDSDGSSHGRCKRNQPIRVTAGRSGLDSAQMVGAVHLNRLGD